MKRARTSSLEQFIVSCLHPPPLISGDFLSLFRHQVQRRLNTKTCTETKIERIFFLEKTQIEHNQLEEMKRKKLKKKLNLLRRKFIRLAISLLKESVQFKKKNNTTLHKKQLILNLNVIIGKVCS